MRGTTLHLSLPHESMNTTISPSTYTQSTPKLPISLNSLYQRLLLIIPCNHDNEHSGIATLPPSPSSIGLLFLTLLPLTISFLLLIFLTGEIKDHQEEEQQEEKSSNQYKPEKNLLPTELTSQKYSTSNLFDNQGLVIGISDIRVPKYRKSKIRRRRGKKKLLEIFPTITEEAEEEEDILSSPGSLSSSTCSSTRSSFESLTLFFKIKQDEQQQGHMQIDSFERGLRMQKFRPRSSIITLRHHHHGDNSSGNNWGINIGNKIFFQTLFWKKISLSVLLTLRPPLWLTFGREGTKLVK